MPIVSELQVSIDGTPLTERQKQLLCQVEVELGVQQQGMLHMQLGAGQDAGGDWALDIARKMIPGSSFSVDVQMGSSPVRLINGCLTQTRLNFTAEVHDSRFEITGMDVLERVKRKSHYRHYKDDLLKVVRQILPEDIPLSDQTPPSDKQISEQQSGTDLEFLTALASKVDREIYVESWQKGDQAFFQKLDFDNAASIPTALRVNVGSQTNVRNAQFHFDLSGPTRVEANNIDKNGKAPRQTIYSDLHDIPTLTEFEQKLLPKCGFQLVLRLNKESQTTPADLKTKCDSELEKHSWVVVGSGELDTAAYGALLYPRRKVNVIGSGSLFSGPYMVWKVTHSFSRDTHCQRFELRRKLGMTGQPGSSASCPSGGTGNGGN